MDLDEPFQGREHLAGQVHIWSFESGRLLEQKRFLSGGMEGKSVDHVLVRQHLRVQFGGFPGDRHSLHPRQRQPTPSRQIVRGRQGNDLPEQLGRPVRILSGPAQIPGRRQTVQRAQMLRSPLRRFLHRSFKVSGCKAEFPQPVVVPSRENQRFRASGFLMLGTAQENQRRHEYPWQTHPLQCVPDAIRSPSAVEADRPPNSFTDTCLHCVLIHFGKSGKMSAPPMTRLIS